MLYLIVLRYIRPLEAINAALDAHRAYLREGYQQGHFLMSGPLEPRTGGAILARAESLQAAQALVAQDPFKQQQLADYEIIAWQPNLRAAGLPAELIPGTPA